MKFLLSIAMAFFCQFPGLAQGELTVKEYHPPPDIVLTETEAPLTGQVIKMKCGYYSAAEACLTAAEITAIEEGPSCWIVSRYGSCKKCSKPELTLINNNGTEICIDACPYYYQFGTYNGTEGCIKCPWRYEFRGGLCRWIGSGPAPPAPTPARPTNLIASQGASAVNIIIKWKKSFSSSTEYYDLERKEGSTADGTSPWSRVAKIREDQNNYYDKSVKTATWYSFRIKACNADQKCSSYSNIGVGYKALQTPEPIHVEIPGDNPTWVKISWPAVPGARYYDVYIARARYRHYPQFGFDFGSPILRINGDDDVYILHYVSGEAYWVVREKDKNFFRYVKDNNRAIFVVARRGPFISYPAVWNPFGPTQSAILRLLLKGK